MLGQVYTASFTGVAVSAAQDLFEILAPADAIIIPLSAHFGQSSDYGDAQAEGLRIRWVRGEGATTGNGTTITPAPHMAGFAASGCTVKRNGTSIMTVGGGSLTRLRPEGFNAQVGYFYQPTPEERFAVSSNDRLTLELIDAPNDELTAEGFVTYMEIGG